MVCQRQLSILFIQNFVITFFQVRPQRSSTNSKAKLTRHPSYNEAIRGRVASNMTKYASSPKLTIPANAHATPSHLNQHNHGSVYNLGGSMSSKATSMVNLKAKKNSLEEKLKKHLPLRKNQSAPMSESNSNTARSRKVRNIFLWFFVMNHERSCPLSTHLYCIIVRLRHHFHLESLLNDPFVTLVAVMDFSIFFCSTDEQIAVGSFLSRYFLGERNWYIYFFLISQSRKA